MNNLLRSTPLRAAAAVILAAILIIPQTGCGSNTGSEPYSKQSFFFDTTCQVSIYDMEEYSEEAADAAIESCFEDCRLYESLLSKTVEDSDIYKINHAGGKPVECDPITIDVIKKGLTYCSLTNGAFDITVGKATDLWDFHGENPKPPTKEELAEAMKYVDYEQIKIDDNTVTMGTKKGEIDLGGIAKGYIADRISEKLREQGVTSAIINLGGNVEVIGDKEGEPFKIGIEEPYSDQSGIIGSTPLTNGTIVTSGVYERYFEYDGVKYHHILDSKTGMPVDSDIVGVSIQAGAGHSVDCDGLSTSCLLLGYDKAKNLIGFMDGYQALFILKDGSVQTTGGFQFEASN